MGKAAEIDRLCGSLLVDISQTRQGLGWTPPVPPSEGLARTAAWYALQRRGRGPLRQ
jgi:UDP-glucose 4-epimerase